jgi:LmbE family N-acetylglucosaminyl deacetylase
MVVMLGENMCKKEIRIMSIMAHQDDFEFNAGGTFLKLKRQYGDSIKIKILTTTRGASGHHEMGLEQTFRRREAEALKSAEILKAEYECLTLLDGSHLAGQVFVDRNFLGGLWNAIRNFEPDYIFCPPVVSDPLAGIHIDHQNTAAAVRAVAYQIGVPHAYPTVGGDVKKRVLEPLVINVDDPYAADEEQPYHISNYIDKVYNDKVEMALCHESQILEWLPFNGGQDGNISVESWKEKFIKRHKWMNKRYGVNDELFREYFRFTSWGRGVSRKDIEVLFPDSDIHNSLLKKYPFLELENDTCINSKEGAA